MKRTKKGVIRLMDYQHFVHNKKLSHLIHETVKNYEEQSQALSDDAPEGVSAAGDPYAAHQSEKEETSDSQGPEHTI